MDAGPIFVLRTHREVSPILQTQDDLNHLEERNRRVAPSDFSWLK